VFCIGGPAGAIFGAPVVPTLDAGEEFRCAVASGLVGSDATGTIPSFAVNDGYAIQPPTAMAITATQPAMSRFGVSEGVGDFDAFAFMACCVTP